MQVKVWILHGQLMKVGYVVPVGKLYFKVGFVVFAAQRRKLRRWVRPVESYLYLVHCTSGTVPAVLHLWYTHIYWRLFFTVPVVLELLPH